MNTDLLYATLRMATPLILAALGGLYSERSGVVNIALEGFILIGSFAGAAVAFGTSSAGAGFLAALAAGALTAALFGLTVLVFRINQIIAGTAINLLALGLTPFLCRIFFDSSTASPALALSERFITFPTILSFFCAALTFYLLRYSAWGLRLTFAGEHPDALTAAGVRVKLMQWQGVLLSGILAAAAGASLSMQLSSSFTRNMSAGRGYMALAALIVGRWRPLPTLCAALAFAFCEALQIELQGVEILGMVLPGQFIQLLPYFVTLLVLLASNGDMRAPKALGA